jgi:hypothetical protein
VTAERCSANTFSGVCVWREGWNGAPVCRYCGTPKAAERKPKTNPRSAEAFASLDLMRLSRREREIVTLIGERGGLATFEVEEALGGLHQSISAAISGLYHKKRMLRPSGKTRKTRTGRRADVYEVGDPLAHDAPVQPKKGKADTRR